MLVFVYTSKLTTFWECRHAVGKTIIKIRKFLIEAILR